jgi:hypothetical protein
MIVTGDIDMPIPDFGSEYYGIYDPSMLTYYQNFANSDCSHSFDQVVVQVLDN